MKVRILIVILSFLTCIPVINAQDVTGKFRIGLSASLEKNVSSDRMAFGQYTGFTADYDKSNYGFGLNMEYLLNGNMTINAAVNYSNKDFIGTYFCDVCDFAFPPSPEEVDFSFIEVPITLKYYFSPHKIGLFGEMGFNNLFPLNDLGYEARVNAFVVGFKLGGGVEYKLSQKVVIQLTLDYSNSISKLFKDTYYKEPYFMLRSINFGIAILRRI